MHFIYVFLPRTDTLCIFTNGLMTLSFLGIQRQVPVFFILKGQIFFCFCFRFFFLMMHYIVSLLCLLTCSLIFWIIERVGSYLSLGYGKTIECVGLKHATLRKCLHPSACIFGWLFNLPSDDK